jgi:hypothetical protein
MGSWRHGTLELLSPALRYKREQVCIGTVTARLHESRQSCLEPPSALLWLPCAFLLLHPQHQDCHSKSAVRGLATARFIHFTHSLLFHTGPEAVEGVSNLKVTTTLTNTGDETLKLLKDPRGALSSAPAHTFTIADETGATPAFIGKKLKYVPGTAIARNKESSFVVLAPGQSVDVAHDRRSFHGPTPITRS